MGSTSRRRTRTSRRRGWIALVAVVVALSVLAAGAVVGCRRAKPADVTTQAPVTSQPATTVPSEPASAEPEPEPEPEPSQPEVVDAGPLHVPQPGTAERQALADAARPELSTQSRFIINQMWSDNAWAIAQLTPKDGGSSRFVAYRHEPSAWVAIWNGPVPGDGRSAILAEDSRFEPEVIGAIKWKGAAASESSGSSARPSNSEAINAAKNLVKKNAADVEITGTELLGLTKDSKGQWWAWVLLKGPSNVDPLTVYAYKSGGSWKLWDYGSDPKPVPAGVNF